MLVTEFRDPVRFYLGDHHDTVRVYEDAVIDRGVRTIIKSGLVPGYSLMSGNLEITPDVPDGSDYLLVSARVALGFAQSVPSRNSVRTRAFSESQGDLKQLIDALERLIYDVEGGGGFLAWQSYLGFVEGYSGMGSRTWQFMTRIHFTGPLSEVSYGEGGFHL